MTERLTRSFIIVEKEGKKPKLYEAPADRRKSSALARKLSGDISDVAWVVDTPYALYKGGDIRILNEKLGKLYGKIEPEDRNKKLKRVV